MRFLLGVTNAGVDDDAKSSNGTSCQVGGRGCSCGGGFEEFRGGAGRQVRHVRRPQRSFYRGRCVVQDHEGFEFLREVPRQRTYDLEPQKVTGSRRAGLLQQLCCQRCGAQGWLRRVRA